MMIKLSAPFDKDMVYIKTPDGIHHNYGVCIWLTFFDAYVINKFQRIVLRIFKSYKDILNIDFMPFVQGKDDNWCYIELWNAADYQDELLKIIELVSIDMNCPSDII